MNEVKKICVVGAGFMGAVIATLYARHGYRVALHDANQEMLSSFRRRASPVARSLAAEGHSIEQILDNVALVPTLEDALDGSFLVHEVVQEVLTAKQELFACLDSRCTADVILATNTSSFLLSDICRDVQRRERVIGIHYITPAHLIPAVELIYADFTPKSLVEWGRNFLATIDHVGVVCRERPAFLINRMQFALLSEVYRIVDEGLASRDDVDAAVRLSLGPRLALWGPLLTEDLIVSKQTTLAVTESLYQKTGDINFAPRKALTTLIDEGSLGAVSGKGWYKFDADYQKIVSERDDQLKELLAWLRQRDATSKLGIAQDQVDSRITGE
jgi:3-hydroxybutyryl-CoA dehydrogenase